MGGHYGQFVFFFVASDLQCLGAVGDVIAPKPLDPKP